MFLKRPELCYILQLYTLTACQQFTVFLYLSLVGQWKKLCFSQGTSFIQQEWDRIQRFSGRSATGMFSGGFTQLQLELGQKVLPGQAGQVLFRGQAEPVKLLDQEIMAEWYRTSHFKHPDHLSKLHSKKKKNSFRNVHGSYDQPHLQIYTYSVFSNLSCPH